MTCFDDNNYYTDQTTYVINKSVNNQELKYLLCVLNSKLIYYYFINTFSDNKITFPKVKRSQLLELPYNSNINQDSLIEKANQKNEIENIFLNMKLSFTKYFQQKYQIEKLTRKLENWQELDFTDFIKELNKAIKKEGGTPLTKKDEFEWLELFEDNKKKAHALQTQITQTEQEIDQMVYELYGLTEEEIAIVEQS
jgi:hypothetical protein